MVGREDPVLGCWWTGKPNHRNYLYSAERLLYQDKASSSGASENTHHHFVARVGVAWMTTRFGYFLFVVVTIRIMSCAQCPFREWMDWFNLNWMALLTFTPQGIRTTLYDVPCETLACGLCTLSTLRLRRVLTSLMSLGPINNAILLV